MKVLIHSNAPWAPTGYGQQTAQLAKRLKAAGHDVAISAFYGLAGSPQMWNDMLVYPQGMHPYGNDVLVSHAEHHFGDARDGVIITLVDAWVLPAEMLADLNVLCWVPVDHDPAPERVVGALYRSKAIPVAMSRHGQRMLHDAGLSPVYAPHGIDTEALRPMDKALSRQRLGLPEDGFVVGMVAANKGTPSRKGFCEAFQAFAAFQRKHPDALLYLHTEVLGACEGVNLVKLAQACGIPETAVHMTHQYQQFILGWPPEHMPYVHSAIDVLLNPAHGEGFGIPVLEAQACGTPAIVTDCTAMTEVCGVGWKVEGQKWWTPQESWATTANVPKLTAALTAAYKKAASMAGRARMFALDYDADKVFEECWVPILDEVERTMVRSDPGEKPEPSVERIAA